MQVCAFTALTALASVVLPPAQHILPRQSSLLLDQDLWIKKNRYDKFITINDLFYKSHLKREC